MRSGYVNEDDYRQNQEEYGALRYSRGEYRGVVVENRDPSGLGRCKVRVYALHGDENAIPDRDLPWATPKTDTAGADSGSFDVPDKGARVWYWFEQGDVNHPIYGGGWVVAGAGVMSAITKPLAQAAQKAAQKVADAAKKAEDAAKAIEDSTKDAADALSMAEAAAAASLNAASQVMASITGLLGTIGSGLSGPGGSGLADVNDPVSYDLDAVRDLENVLRKAKYVDQRAAMSVEKAHDTNVAIAALAAETDEIAKEVDAVALDTADEVNSLIQETEKTEQGAKDRDVKHLQKVRENATTVSESVKLCKGAALDTERATGHVMQSAGHVKAQSERTIDVAQKALAVVLASPLQTVGGAQQALSTLINVTQSIQDELNGKVANALKESGVQVKACSGSGGGAAKAAKKAAGQSATTERRIVAMPIKKLGKKEDDPAIYPSRPQPFNDDTWEFGAGSEISKESQQMANNVPSVRTWKKSGKGHTLVCDDQDAKENLQLIDRAGNALYFDCPVAPDENTGNQEQRGARSALNGDPIDRDKMRDLGSRIGLQDQAQSKVELDSRQQAEKIVIIANDGKGGVENGKSRQVIKLHAGGNFIEIESVQDGEVNAKVLIDSNSGAVFIESARFATIHAPYITINGDHINLNGRCNVNGDLTVSGRLTGGQT